jgi:hypothetical protein
VLDELLESLLEPVLRPSLAAHGHPAHGARPSCSEQGRSRPCCAQYVKPEP